MSAQLCRRAEPSICMVLEHRQRAARRIGPGRTMASAGARGRDHGIPIFPWPCGPGRDDRAVCGDTLVWKPSEKMPLCVMVCHAIVTSVLAGFPRNTSGNRGISWRAVGPTFGS